MLPRAVFHTSALNENVTYDNSEYSYLVETVSLEEETMRCMQYEEVCVFVSLYSVYTKCNRN